MKSQLNSQVFAQCIAALRRGDVQECERLARGLDIGAGEPAGQALRGLLKEIAASGLRPGTGAFGGRRAGRPTVFAVVTPSFNAAKYISATIASVLSQQGDFQLLYHVQDGNSGDGTVDILREWQRACEQGRFGDPSRVRFSWSSAGDAGMYDAIVRGFESLRPGLAGHDPDATLMTWLNADDIFASQALATVESFFSSRPEYSWVTGMGALMNEAGAIGRTFQWPKGFSRQDLALGLHDGRSRLFVQQEGTFWRLPLWTRTGGLNSRRFRLAGDWDLWRRFAMEAPLVKLEAVLGVHRRRPGQLSEDAGAYYREVDSADPLPAREIARLGSKRLLALFGPNAQSWDIAEPEADAREVQALTPVLNLPSASDALVEDSPPPERLPSGKPWPRISVITPSYNQGRYIAETIQSVIDQRYPDVEHIIIDGGSTDDTMEVIQPFRKHLAHVVSERDKGQSDALNKGFAKATGDILCWLNSDDQYAPGALRAVALAFDTQPADMVSGIVEVYQEGKLVHRHMSACKNGPLPLEDLLDLDTGWNTGQFFYQPEVFFTRDLWQRAGGHVREDCFYSMDYELWCRFAYANAQIHVIGSPLARFRMHPDQKTADPSKFKAELVTVRDRFAADRAIEVPRSRRPPADWERRLRVAMVNDIGFRFGAGIAHGRLATGIDMAGHDVAIFDLSKILRADGKLDELAVVREVADFAPDVVIFGNLHSADRESVTLLDQLGARYPTYWVTHDFWLFTGRCAYNDTCTKYVSGCDESCPTPSQYPELAPARIRNAWRNKRTMLKGPNAPTILGNSNWTVDFVREVKVTGAIPDLAVSRIQLGAPAQVFRKMSKAEARSRVGINPASFVIVFSVSSMAEERKGGAMLMEAIGRLDVPNVCVLVMGYADAPLVIPGVEVVMLGYVADTPTLVHALNAADVYVGPSKQETFGQVFIEAAMVGTPSIGLDQTGVVDAIVHGVTGLRVKPSAGALREAILTLYNDKAYCDHLGYWARIHAANEFSLESSFRSLFEVWSDQGLVDRWKLPHKVGFLRPSQFEDDGTGEHIKWIAGKGVSMQEGPYPPDFPDTFNWLFGNESTVKLRFGNGPNQLKITYYCPLFDDLTVDVYRGTLKLCELQLKRTPVARMATVEQTIQGHEGWAWITLRPRALHEPEGTELRYLSFMLHDIDLDWAGKDGKL